MSRTDYAALFAVIGTSYGAGDGTNTFNLPNLVDKFVEGSTTAGTEKTAGLPNITGAFSFHGAGTASAIYYVNGSLVGGNRVNGQYRTVSDLSIHNSVYSYGGIELNASISSAVYGNSTTVQPPALTMKPFIYTGKTALYKWKRTA